MVPSYLENYATELSVKNKCCKFNLVCTCGCEHFYTFRRERTKREVSLENEAQKRIVRNFGRNYEISSDTDKTVYLIKRNLFGKIVKKEPFSGYCIPAFKNLVAIKCKDCGNVIIVFDESKHGYDAFESSESNASPSPFTEMNFSNEWYKVEVNVYYEPSEIDNSVGDPSVAFDRMKIIKVSGNKKQTLGDFECA